MATPDYLQQVIVSGRKHAGSSKRTSAAETGHLVMSTLHTINAGQTINRIVGMFDQAEEQQIRIRLAETVRWIVSQRLLPKVGGGRVAALEIMGNNLRVKDAIEHGESEGKTFYEIIEASSSFGWKGGRKIPWRRLISVIAMPRSLLPGC